MFALIIKFFALLNPLGCMAQFVSLLRHFPPARQRAIIARESLIALAFLLAAAFFGDRALYYLGIQITAVQVGGGIILLLVALPMLFPAEKATQGPSAGAKITPIEPYVVPLAIPLLAGPGILAMVLIESAKSMPHQTSGALIVVWSFCTAVLMISPQIGRYLGERGISVLERFVGLVLIFISVNMILDGLKTHFNL